MSEVREQSNKEGRLWFLGVDAEEYTGELPEARSRLCVCRDSFLMTFVTSGISLAGSRQSSIAPNAVESREAPPNTTVSVSSQRHPEQLLRSPAQVEGTQGLLPQPEKDLKSPSSTRLEAGFPYHDSRAMTRSPSPCAWTPDFPGAT